MIQTFSSENTLISSVRWRTEAITYLKTIKILEILDKLPPSYSTFRDIQLLTPPESVKDLQNLLHIGSTTRDIHQTKERKHWQALQRRRNNTKDKMGTLPVGSVERRVIENRNAKIALNKSDSWIKNQSMLRLHDAPMHAWREENKRIPRRKHQRTEWGVITPSLLATWLKIEQIWSPKSPNGRNLSVLHLCAPRIFETGATSHLI